MFDAKREFNVICFTAGLDEIELYWKVYVLMLALVTRLGDKKGTTVFILKTLIS